MKRFLSIMLTLVMILGMLPVMTTIAATVLSAAIAQAGNFTAYDFGAFKMHVYNSGDVMGDASFIVEGKSELVVLEVPLFQENAKEFDAYVAKLQKPIVASITDYHEGAVKDSKLYVAEGMKSFLVGPIYGGMMKGFQKQWAGKLVILPDVSKATEVKFGETVTLAGISFRFEKGAATDFPAAGICIGGKVYLNVDNDYIFEKSGEYDSITYAIKNDKADVIAKDVVSSKNGLKFTVCYKDKKFTLTTSLLGSHNILNILSAVAIAMDLGVDENDIKYAVENLSATEHRLELKPFINGALLIDDAYNANPAGCLEAMRVIGSFSPMKRIVVTPGLVELGEKEYECNKALGVEAAKNADVIILVG